MKLTPQQVAQIAHLARLSLTSKETENYAEQLSVIFGYMEMLNEVTTDAVQETCQVTGLMNVVREDVVFPISEEKRKKLIQAFPQKAGDLLKVKAVFQDPV